MKNKSLQSHLNEMSVVSLEAEFKEFEPRLKYGWFHLKSYPFFKNLSQSSILTGGRCRRFSSI